MFDVSDGFGKWLADTLLVIAGILVFFWVFISFLNGVFILPEYKKAISSDEMKIAPDTYLVSNDHFVEIKGNNEFRDVYNGQESKGRWSQNGKVLTLAQENGSKTELCVFFDSNILLGVSDDCPCNSDVITEKSCWHNKLIRKGAIADLIPSN